MPLCGLISHFAGPPRKALINSLVVSQFILIPANTEPLDWTALIKQAAKLLFTPQPRDPQANQISPDKDFNFLYTSAPFTLPVESLVLVKSW